MLLSARRNYLRLASRIDAVAGRVETAVRMRMVTKSMGGIVKSLEAASKSMNLEKVRWAAVAVR